MEELSTSRDPGKLRGILDYLGMPAFVIDVISPHEFRLAAINARHEQITGMCHEQVAGRDIDELLDRFTAATVKASYRRCVQAKAATDYQETLDLPAGRTYWQTTLVPFLDKAGTVTRLLGTAHEISSQVHLELEARYQATVMSAYLEESPDGILVVDARHRMKTWNRRFLDMWKIPDEIMESRDGDAALQAVREQLAEPKAFVRRVSELYTALDEEEQGVRVPMKDGRVLQRFSRGLEGPDGDYWGRIWFYRDITEQELLTGELIRMSRTDPLTGAANRRAFMVALDEEYARARRYGHELAVLMLDVDHFKRINDHHGHAAGDQALKNLVRLVAPEMRATDCFARMGGEEFAVLLPETGLDAARNLAERLRDAAAGLSLTSEKGEFGITVSIGVAQLQAQDTEPEELLNRADRCLYTAKSEGRNRVFP